MQPYGSGEKADVFFELNGYWNSYEDRDSRLTISFPKEGDGIAEFEPDLESKLISPHEAFAEGYSRSKNWRKQMIPNPEYSPQDGVYEKIIQMNETVPPAYYFFRIRTALDEDGNIVSSNYGKIYGNLLFDGATRIERFDGIILSYYVNPAPNDRNLEFDRRRNLANPDKVDLGIKP